MGEGDYASVAAILSSQFYGPLPPGDKCANYCISYPGLLLLPLPSWLWPLVLPWSSALDSCNFCSQTCSSEAVLRGPCFPALSLQTNHGRSCYFPFLFTLPVTLWVKCWAKPEAVLASSITENGPPGLGHFTLNSPTEEVRNRLS